MQPTLVQAFIVLVLCTTGTVLILLGGGDAAAKTIGIAAIGGAINAAPGMLTLGRSTRPLQMGPGGASPPSLPPEGPR